MNINNIFEVDSENQFGICFNESRKIKFKIPKILESSTTNKNKIQEISLLKNYVYLLKSYVNSESSDLLFSTDSNSNISSLSTIDAYINIIDDYLKNGDFINFVQHHTKSQNRIDWIRTIKENEVIIQNKTMQRSTGSEQEGKILYGSFKSKKKEIDENDIFLKIYIKVLNDAKIMFLEGNSFSFDKTIEEKNYVHYINKYLDTHFKDREIFIAKQLQKIYSVTKQDLNQDLKFNVKYHKKFEYIFQFLIEKNIKDYSIFEKTKKDKLIGKYKFNDNSKTLDGLNLKLDHIIRSGNKCLIIDSKFYQKTNCDMKNIELPKTADIMKQVGYKLYIEKKLGIDISNIENIFIFPNDKDNIEYFANHSLEGDDKNLFFIKCFKVNVNNLITNFIKRKNYDELTDMLLKYI